MALNIRNKRHHVLLEISLKILSYWSISVETMRKILKPIGRRRLCLRNNRLKKHFSRNAMISHISAYMYTSILCKEITCTTCR